MKIRGSTIKQNWHVFTGISIISAGMLAYEIILTRILSVILSYHYVFAVISLAMLGLGLGAILNHLMQSKLSRLSRFNRLALLASLLAASIPLSLLIIFGISSTQSLSSNTFIYLLIIIIPFCSAGILFAELFRSYTESSSWLYGFDLLGASLGAAGAIFVMNIFGGIKSAAIISSLIWLAALLYTMTSLRTLIHRNWQSIIGGLLIFSLASTIFTNLRIADIPVMNQEKEMANIISNSSSPAKIVETRWNAFGRTDLVAYENDPSRMAIFIDGTAGAYMYRFNGDFNNPDPSVKNLQTSFPGYLALSIMPENGENSALIIGPGGGMDVLLAQMAGINQITAVEVNQAAVDIVRQYGQYNGHLYEAENVSVIVDEGRSFLKRQKMQYDIIMLSIPLTKTSRSPEGFALTENFLFTTNSINDYLNHLTDNGRLIVVAHNEIEIIRLLSLSLAAINQSGIDSFAAMQRVAVIGSHHYPVFILKKTPFNQAEAISLHRSIHELGFAPEMSYIPDIKTVESVFHTDPDSYLQCSGLNSLLIATSQGKIKLNELYNEAARNGIDIRPVSDDNPFFYKFHTGLPTPVVLVFWLSAISLALAIFGYLIRVKVKTYRGTGITIPTAKNSTIRTVLLFSLLGAGFMLIEISLFQKLSLFLGQPVLSLVVLLSSLLLSAGLGSLYSNRFREERLISILKSVTPIIASILLIYIFSLPTILNQLIATNLNLRLLIAVILVFPCGFLLGFPFPLGMRLLKLSNQQSSISWMWGINGLASVLGSVLAIILGISFSFSAGLILGAICYLAIFFLFWGRNQPEFYGYNKNKDIKRKDYVS